MRTYLIRGVPRPLPNPLPDFAPGDSGSRYTQTRAPALRGWQDVQNLTLFAPQHDLWRQGKRT